MMRIGHGFDVHAFGPGDHVVLGGERIPHDRGLVAHSDGDVVLHALCDALLGAAALGDIGGHFPDTDPGFAGADSRHLLREVRALLALLSVYLRNEVTKLISDGVRLRVIGRRDRFSPRLQRLIAKAEAATAAGDRATLTLALDYGGRWDVAEVTRSIAHDVAAGRLNPDAVDEDAISARLATADIPDPDLCIRTAGETRISNFLLWQFAYAEFWFTEVLWPDFDETVLDLALADYAVRERRFGVRPLLHQY